MSSADAAVLSDETSVETLGRVIEDRPDLQVSVAWHPNVNQDLLELLRDSGTPQAARVARVRLAAKSLGRGSAPKSGTEPLGPPDQGTSSEAPGRLEGTTLSNGGEPPADSPPPPVDPDAATPPTGTDAVGGQAAGELTEAAGPVGELTARTRRTPGYASRAQRIAAIRAQTPAAAARSGQWPTRADKPAVADAPDLPQASPEAPGEPKHAAARLDADRAASDQPRHAADGTGQGPAKAAQAAPDEPSGGQAAPGKARAQAGPWEPTIDLAGSAELPARTPSGREARGTGMWRPSIGNSPVDVGPPPDPPPTRGRQRTADSPARPVPQTERPTHPASRDDPPVDQAPDKAAEPPLRPPPRPVVWPPERPPRPVVEPPGVFGQPVGSDRKPAARPGRPKTAGVPAPPARQPARLGPGLMALFVLTVLLLVACVVVGALMVGGAITGETAGETMGAVQAQLASG
ncbi:MAG: hypothetical protein LBO20_07215 [Bifidobacteriaceae bacterium]|nr:hypothetical protein [Bifidobacteriaceae bacterium]